MPAPQSLKTAQRPCAQLTKWRTRLKPLALTIFAAALLFGCVTANSGDFCDIARPIYFDSENVVSWLSEHDSALLRDIVAHNEKTTLCR